MTADSVTKATSGQDLPDGFARLDLVVQVTNSTAAPLLVHRTNVETGYGQFPVVAAAVSTDGFVYGLFGSDKPRLGQFDGYSWYGGPVPAGVTMPLHLAVDVPAGSTDLTIRLNVADANAAPTASCAGPCETTLPLTDFANRSPMPMSFANATMDAVGTRIQQGPLAATVTSPHLIVPCKGPAQDNLWMVEFTVKAANSYGYGLWNSGAYAVLYDGEGGVWSNQGPIWPPKAYSGVPPKGSLVFTFDEPVSNRPPSGCGAARPKGHMYLLFVMPPLSYNSQPLAGGVAALYDLGVLKP